MATRVPTRPTLRQLEYVVALAEHLHFGRAARSVGVSQPGLSTQLKQLEQIVGVQLFERSPRGVAITKEGQALAERAAALIADLDEVLSTFERTDGQDADGQDADGRGADGRGADGRGSDANGDPEPITSGPGTASHPRWSETRELRPVAEDLAEDLAEDTVPSYPATRVAGGRADR